MAKRILIHDYAGHPFQIELSRELARRGNDVSHVYYGGNNTPKGDLKVHGETDSGSLSIECIFTKQPINKYSYIKRWTQEIEYGNLLVKEIKKIRPDIVVSANTPLDTQYLVFQYCKRKGIKFVFWLQDFIGIATDKLLRNRIPIAGSIIGKYYIHLERKLLRESNDIVSIAPEFETILKDWGVKKEKIHCIPNWAPLQNVPVRKKNNAWAAANKLDNKFCFMYTGMLGFKHNPDLLLQLAIHYKNQKDVLVCVISEGNGIEYLKEKKQAHSLDNLVLLHYQPFEDMPDVMGSSDILIAILEADAGIFSVPSKTLTYLCASRPVLMAVPLENLAAKIVIENQAGMVISPGDSEGFLSAADTLLMDTAKRQSYAKNARSYAEKNFNIGLITDQFEKVVS